MRARIVTRKALLLTLAVVAASAATLAGRAHRMVQPSAVTTVPVYDKAREVTVSGRVSEIRDGARTDSGFYLEHVVITTDTGAVTIELAPTSFLKSRDFGILDGDTLEAVGSPAKYQDQPVVLAREVRHAGAKVVLRDADGRPEWLKRLREVRFLIAGN